MKNAPASEQASLPSLRDLPTWQNPNSGRGLASEQDGFAGPFQPLVTTTLPGRMLGAPFGRTMRVW